MAEDVKVVTEPEKVEKKTPEAIPYDRFAQVISEKKELEGRLQKLEDAKKAEEIKAAEELAKKSGDYSKLVEQLTQKETQVKEQEQKMKDRIANMTVQTLAIKHGIAKPEYVKLFTTKVEVADDLEVKDFKEVEKAFEAWKKENPNLFATGKKVPETDTKLKHEINIDANKDLSIMDKIRLGMEERKIS